MLNPEPYDFQGPRNLRQPPRAMMRPPFNNNRPPHPRQPLPPRLQQPQRMLLPPPPHLPQPPPPQLAPSMPPNYNRTRVVGHSSTPPAQSIQPPPRLPLPLPPPPPPPPAQAPTPIHNKTRVTGQSSTNPAPSVAPHPRPPLLPPPPPPQASAPAPAPASNRTQITSQSSTRPASSVPSHPPPPPPAPTSAPAPTPAPSSHRTQITGQSSSNPASSVSDSPNSSSSGSATSASPPSHKGMPEYYHQPVSSRPKTAFRIATSLHAGGANDPNAPPCAFWISGFCKRGKGCTFRHDSPFAVHLPALPDPEDEVCRKFLRGQCNFGERCRYRHPPATLVDNPLVVEEVVLPNDAKPVQPRESSKATHSKRPIQTLERTVRGSMVAQFGPGLDIVDMSLTNDNVPVTLTELPRDFTKKELAPIVKDYGVPIKLIVEKAAKGGRRAILTYSTREQAMRAVRGLDGLLIGGNTVQAKMTEVASESDAIPTNMRTNAIKLSCPLPTVSAILSFDSSAYARRRAQALTGRLFDGKRITAYYQDETGVPCVVIPKLAVTTDPTHICRMAYTNQVRFTEPTFTTRDAQPALTELLNKVGTVESFYVYPYRPGDTRMRASVCFTRSEDVDAAIGKYDGTLQRAVAGNKINVVRTFLVRFAVSSTHWTVVSERVRRIRATEMSRALLRIVEPSVNAPPDTPITLYVQGEEPTSLSALKAKVQDALQGELLRDDEGTIVWDLTFFTSTNGRIFLQGINEEQKVFIKCDPRLRCIRISGPDEAIADARQKILWRYNAHKQERRVVHIRPESVRHFVRGGLRTLQEALGRENVSLNIIDRQVIFRCSDDKVPIVQRAANHVVHARTHLAAKKSRGRPSRFGDVTCPVCHCDVVDAVDLGCGHSYCKPCLQLYLSSAPTSENIRFPISCIATAKVTPGAVATDKPTLCGEGIPARTIQNLLSPDEEHALIDAAFLAYVHSHPNSFRFCPTPDCDQVYRVAPPNANSAKSSILFTCPGCLETICTSCHLAHPGLSCAQYRANRAQQISTAPSTIKRCPGGCGALLQKQDGCNHITCIVCKTHMCWLCMATFPNGGVYEHIAKVHREGFAPGQLPPDDLVLALAMD